MKMSEYEIEINSTFYGPSRSESPDPQAVAMTAGNLLIPPTTSLTGSQCEALQ